MSNSPSRIRRFARQARRTFDEVSYAQRRLFELQTELPDGPVDRRAASARQLERLYRR